jgi:integrase
VAQTTELELKALTAANDGATIMDGDGLRGKVRHTRDGIAVYFEYRFRGVNGKTRSVSCGSWPKLTLKKIRLARDAFRSDVAKGVDPVQTRVAADLRAAADQAEAIAVEKSRIAEVANQSIRLNVRGLFDLWQAMALASRKDGGAEVRRMFEKDVFPAIGDMAVEDVKKGHVAAMLDKIKARGVNRMVNMMLSLTRQMFLFAVSRDHIEADPTAALKKKDFGGKDVERDRYLTEGEIRELRANLPAAKLSRPTALALWIMLSTTCRVGELSKAEWSHLDFDKRTWWIPAANSKNGDEITIHLSDFSLEQFKQLADVQMSKRWLYPASKPDANGNETHIDEKSITKQIRDRQRIKPLKGRTQCTSALILSGGEWTPHDLRRTGATLMGDLGVDENIIDRCQNHKQTDAMKRVYQRSKREADMAAAWQLLGERLDLLSRPDSENAISLNLSKRSI